VTITRWMLSLLVLAGAAAGARTVTAATEVETKRIVGPGVLDRPVFATAPPNDTQRVFVLEQHQGQIRVLHLADGSVDETPFLTIASVSQGGEQGLLGLAFHPDYSENGLFFVNYTQANGDTVIARYTTSADPDVAIATETRLLTIDQPQGNHNGGWIGFSPIDGYLYVATGDGGSANDSGTGHNAVIGNGQDLNSLLGKILRIDVDGDDFPADPDRNYAIPPDNPFVDAVGADEIWAYGLRNPYRASFDRETGDLFIGDVGQNNREEIDVQPAGQAGDNFGWRLREGTIATPTGGVGGIAPGAFDPIFDYLHGSTGFQGFAVIGGVVYRGPVASLRGTYFFGDHATGRLWSLRFDGSPSSEFDGSNFTDLTDHTLAADPRFTPDAGSFGPITSFGEDAAGNFYITKLGTPGDDPDTDTGEVFRVPEPNSEALALAAVVAAAALRRRIDPTR